MSAQNKTVKDDRSHVNPSALPSLGNTPSSSSKGKELESSDSLRKEEDRVMAEITTTADAIDREAIAKARESFPEIKQAVPEPELKPDVEDAGVKVPSVDAEDVITSGPTIELGTSENIYKKGLGMKVTGRVVGSVGNKIVVGVSSLAALAMWVGRMVKMAHKHAMKVVFRNAD